MPTNECADALANAIAFKHENTEEKTACAARIYLYGRRYTVCRPRKHPSVYFALRTKATRQASHKPWGT